ncbi:hypothetical protein GCM10022631_10730 [Deinococcus rubellus]|uniref:hypothetical protein n=1 Tax=Deinococcus rubellus TaxID=1889240 RepID=UPI0031E5913D
MGILLTMVGLVALALGLIASSANKRRVATPQERKIATWGVGGGAVLLLLGFVLDSQNEPVQPTVSHAKSTAQLQAEDDAAVHQVALEQARADSIPNKNGSVDTERVVQHSSHDQPSEILFTVVGGLPNGWAVSTTNTEGAAYFGTDRLLGLNENGARVACNQYGTPSGGQFERRSWTKVFGADEALWPMFFPQLQHPENAGLFLDTLDAICMAVPKTADITQETESEDGYRLPEVPTLTVVRVGDRVEVRQ